MALPAIDELPEPPSVTDPANFQDEAEPFVLALVTLVLQANAWSAALTPHVNALIAAAATELDQANYYNKGEINALDARSEDIAFFLATTF